MIRINKTYSAKNVEKNLNIGYNDIIIKIKVGDKMINLLLIGNEKVFDGALTELISITNKTKEPINCYILTMEVTRIKKEYTAIKDEQIDFLNKVVKTKNADNQITQSDVTDLYEK